MKRKLILLMSVMALMMPQTMWAQEGKDNGPFWSIHKKDNNPDITLDTKPEEIIDKILMASGGEKYMMRSGTWLEQQRKVTDGFGNVHVTYNQKSDPEDFSEYQIMLHFRPDGSLYYRNGMILTEERGAQKAKAIKPENRITAERASIIATGSPMSKAVFAIANYEDQPREAYKVKDERMMQYVYVDAHSGEVLYTIPLFDSFAPWDEVKGNAVTLSANTSYNGLRELTVMQTDKGYILRDPERNIITIDGTDILADRDSTNLPKNYTEQFQLFTGECDDVLFANKEDLLNQKYTAAIRSVTFWLDPEIEDAPDSLNLHIFYRNKDKLVETEELINFGIKDITWTDDNGRRKYTYTFEPYLSMNTTDYMHIVELKIDGSVYFRTNIISPGNREAARMYSGTTILDTRITDMECFFDVAVNATQPAIDVHWNVQKVYDMYNEYFGIKGCDGKGTQTLNIVNPGNNVLFLNTVGFPKNAVASAEDYTDCNGVPTYLMMYGMGVAAEFKPNTPLDVSAHEYTHNVTAGCCNRLHPQKESGALNEALADCMAMVAEDYALGAPTWMVGEDVTLMKKNLRDFTNPWYSGCSLDDDMTISGVQPKYYKGEFWVDTRNLKDDHGGVHANSGVFNHLFYLLCEGGEGLTNEKEETRDIIPVGMAKMKDILFHTMRYYNASLCDYAEIADNLLMAIEDLYSDNGETIADLQEKFLAAYEHVGMQSDMFPTDITRLQMTTPAKISRAYNLYGIPVGDDYKGMVIKNGKKMIVN